jgi:phi13 family phage major tail protein
MARIGLKNFRYGILDEETEKYGGSLQLGKAIDCKVSLDLNSAELYADDGLAESDYSVKKGTVTITIDEDDDTTLANLTGHEISKDGELVRKDTDTPPYVGFGRIITKVVSGKYKYKVEFLSKVKFKDALPDEKTKGENVEFTTTSLEGTVLKLKDGTWSKTKTFDTYEDAITYLDSLLKAEAEK